MNSLQSKNYNEHKLTHITVGVYSSSTCPSTHEFISPSSIQVNSIQDDVSIKTSGGVADGESFTFTCTYPNIQRYSKIYNKWYYGDRVSGLSLCYAQSLA